MSLSDGDDFSARPSPLKPCGPSPNLSPASMMEAGKKLLCLLKLPMAIKFVKMKENLRLDFLYWIEHTQSVFSTA